MITAISIENFKGIREPVEIEIRPLTLFFGANSAGKSSILHALQYAQEAFLRHNLDADRTLAGGTSVDLGGFKNLVNNHALDKDVRFHFSMAFNNELPGSWDPDDEYSDPEYVHLSGRIIAARVGISIRWSEWDRKPFVNEYTVELNGQAFAKIKCDAPRRNIRITDLDAQHPVFFDWSAMRNRFAPTPGEPAPEFPKQQIEWSEEMQRVLSHFPTPTLEFEKEDPAFFSKLLAETQQWILPVGELGAIGILDQEDALLSYVQEDRYSHLRIATKYGEGEAEFGDDELTFFQQRPKLSYLTRILHNLIIGPGLAVRRWLENFRSLGPVRETPPRDYRAPKSPDPGRWGSGLGAWDRLANGDDEFIEAVSHWLGDTNRLNSGYRLLQKRFKELDLTDPLVVKLLTGRAFDEAEAGAKLDLSKLPTQSRLLIVPTDDSIELRPSDVGIGISQVVPVIVTALDGVGRTVSIEQPELHLHPKLQAELGDLFVESAKGKPKHVVILETHSELIPLRLMRRIKETFEKRGDPDRPGVSEEDVAIYYVEPFKGATVVTRLHLSDRGQLLDPWPEGFFEEGYRERFSD